MFNWEVVGVGVGVDVLTGEVVGVGVELVLVETFRIWYCCVRFEGEFDESAILTGSIPF